MEVEYDVEKPAVEYYETPEELLEAFRDGSLRDTYPIVYSAMDMLLTHMGGESGTPRSIVDRESADYLHGLLDRCANAIGPAVLEAEGTFERGVLDDIPEIVEDLVRHCRKLVKNKIGIAAAFPYDHPLRPTVRFCLDALGLTLGILEEVELSQPEPSASQSDILES